MSSADDSIRKKDVYTVLSYRYRDVWKGIVFNSIIYCKVKL